MSVVVLSALIAIVRIRSSVIVGVSVVGSVVAMLLVATLMLVAHFAAKIFDLIYSVL